MMIPHNNSRGYILECDLGKYYFYYLYTYTYLIKCNATFLCISEYPHELHDLHKDYPLTPERLQIEESILSDYQRHLLQDEGFTYQNELHHPLSQFKVVLGTRNASHQRPSRFVVRSIVMVEKLHQVQHLSTYSCEKRFWKRFL